MTFRVLLCALCVTALAGCETPYKKSDAETKRQEKNFSKDQAFQSVLGRLRIAVEKKDRQTLVSLMSMDFGWRWDQPPPNESPFDYWDQHNSWPELARTLGQSFEPHDGYMVAPPAVVKDPKYDGYRVGMRVENGSWRLAYFVPGEPKQ